jgi:hypothetical protein
MSEEQLQTQTASWLRLQHPRLLAYHIPNGGARDVRVGKKLKTQGVMRGVPDWFVSVSNRKYHGLYIELKVGTNKQTDEQKLFEQRSTENGYLYEVCRTLEEFVKTITRYIHEK